MDTTNEIWKNTSFREELEESIEANPFDDWDLGWNAAIRFVLERLDKYKVEVV